MTDAPTPTASDPSAETGSRNDSHGVDVAPTTGGSVPGGSPWSGRTHAELAELARELLLAGHLIDRSGMPHLIAAFGRDDMAGVAIDEWMAASPIYTKRMQRLLSFEGDDVETIFKGMQLDVGAPPEFMDFRYTVHDRLHGEFHLDHCGALMDVEPMGEDFVQAMCHDIEDPTFDATATATNPRAQVRPIHRPPREPADRTPHCHWTVTIVEDADPLPYPPQAERLGRSKAAALPLATAPADLSDDDGWSDYSVPLDPDLVMERFSSSALARICDEVALQGHLLSRAYLEHVVELSSPEQALDIGGRQLAGVAGVVAKRLGAALGIGTDDLAGVAEVLAVHPMFLPLAYVDLRIDGPGTPGPGGHADGSGGEAVAGQSDVGELVVSIGDCPSLAEDDGLTWPAVLVHGSDAGLRAAVQCVAPRARVERMDPVDGAEASWRVRLDPTADPLPQDDDVTLTEFSTGAGFSFHRREVLR